MKTAEIQKIVGKSRVLAGHTCVLENVNYLLNHELDVMSFKNGMLYEYEVKISRSDFLADKKKRKYSFFIDDVPSVPEWQPNYFSYVVPDGLISSNEVPTFAGLYYVTGGYLKLIKQPKKLSNYRHDIQKIQKKVITVYQERIFLGCCLMTYKNKIARGEESPIELPNVQGSDTTKSDSSNTDHK